MTLDMNSLFRALRAHSLRVTLIGFKVIRVSGRWRQVLLIEVRGCHLH